jgi:hypothetical protein
MSSFGRHTKTRNDIKSWIDAVDLDDFVAFSGNTMDDDSLGSSGGGGRYAKISHPYDLLRADPAPNTPNWLTERCARRRSGSSRRWFAVLATIVAVLVAAWLLRDKRGNVASQKSREVAPLSQHVSAQR